MKLGLAFSGGKDSWACLFLMKDKLREITVFWVDTGKNYPETVELISKAEALCPNFVSVRTEQGLQNLANGLPSDVVPVNWTTLGQIYTGRKAVKIQSYLECCYANISAPLNQAVKEHGITHLISGQRNSEGHKSPIRDGMEVDGVTHVHPIETWTELEIMSFLSTHMEIPAHFSLKHSSLDCYDCTAYKKDSQDRINWMEREHPVLFQAYLSRKEKLDTAISEAL